MTDARLLNAWLFRKFDGEIKQPLLALINFAEIEAGRDFADLIANAVREERGLEVAEDDALLRQFGHLALYIRPSIALTSELTSMTSELSDFKKLYLHTLQINIIA